MSVANPDRFPSQAMPAGRPRRSRRGIVFGSLLGAGLGIFLLLDADSFLHDMIFRGTPFSWEAVLHSLAAYGHALFLLYVVLAGAAMFLENRNPDRTIAWLLVLGLFPLVGVVLYWVMGPNFRYQEDKRRFRLPKPTASAANASAREKVAPAAETAMLLGRSAGAPLLTGENVTIFHDGAETFAAVKGWMRTATRTIFVESFIIDDDTLGGEIKEILMERAKAGVFVCLVYDAAGCWRLPSRYVRELRDAGVHVHAFLPVAFPMFRGANYRNHRKIIIIDGKIALTGGLNIGDNYVSNSPRWSYWRDSHMALSGPAAAALREVFLNDLAACGLPAGIMREARRLSEPEPALAASPDPETAQAAPAPLPLAPAAAAAAAAPVPTANAAPGPVSPPSLAARAVMQIVPGGPDTPWDAIRKGYFSIFARARERLWITTPYLVPGDALMEALCIAALSGVDVRVLLPGKRDHILVHWATMNCYDELLRAGVRIFLYDKTGFVHAKTLTCDGALLSVGSANLDTRSLQINFEVQAFIYDPTLARREEAVFARDVARSEELTLTAWRARPRFQRVKESIGKLFSSLL